MFSYDHKNRQNKEDIINKSKARQTDIFNFIVAVLLKINYCGKNDKKQYVSNKLIYYTYLLQMTS